MLAEGQTATAPLDNVTFEIVVTEGLPVAGTLPLGMLKMDTIPEPTPVVADFEITLLATNRTVIQRKALLGLVDSKNDFYWVRRAAGLSHFAEYEFRLRLVGLTTRSFSQWSPPIRATSLPALQPALDLRQAASSQPIDFVNLTWVPQPANGRDVVFNITLYSPLFQPVETHTCGLGECTHVLVPAQLVRDGVLAFATGKSSNDQGVTDSITVVRLTAVPLPSSTSSSLSNGEIAGVVIGVCIAVLLILILVVLRWRTSKPAVRIVPDDWEVPRSCVRLGNVAGQGNFGWLVSKGGAGRGGGGLFLAPFPPFFSFSLFFLSFIFVSWFFAPILLSLRLNTHTHTHTHTHINTQ